MSFASQLVVAFIIFGVFATIIIAALIVVIGNQEKHSDAIAHEQNHGSSV